MSAFVIDGIAMENMNLIGVTERGDASIDTSWKDWVFMQRRPAILISKDPLKLFTEVTTMIDQYGFCPNIIVHCTITGFGGTKIEPNVPKVDISLEGYSKFVNLLGKDRVVLRCDPVIPTEKCVVFAATTVMSKTLGTRIRFSFLDLYYHVKQRFIDAEVDIDKLGIKDGSLHASLDNRLELVQLMKRYVVDPSMLSACGEPGIQSEPCVSKRDCDILRVDLIQPAFKQRFACHCAANKTELLKTRGQCKHGCLYCYWKE